MRYLLRLDLERIRLNLEDTAEAPQSLDDAHRLLAGLGVWRHSDEWWAAESSTLKHFRPGEIIDSRKQV